MGVIGLKETEKKKQVFLATTALEEFWDTSKPIVFLGEWCRRYSRRSYWGPLNGEVINSRWSEQDKLLDACNYVNDFYEEILTCLAEALNPLHNVNHSERYWRIVLGPWLQLYVSVIYDRYTVLLDALERHPDFTTFGLSEDSFVVPRDTLEFVQLLKGDPYNLQIYTNVLLFLEKEFTRKNMNVTTAPFIKAKRFGSIKGTAKRFTENIWKGAGRHWGSGSIVLRSSYFSRIMELKLFITTLGKVWPVTGEVLELPFFAPNGQHRMTLQNALPGNSEFEKLIKKMLPFDIPQCFIEGFKTLTKDVENSYPVKPKGIFSANAWYYDEVFKRWAATSAEDGTILMGTQHGGNYGSVSPMPSEDHETAIVDRYYSWGWERSDCKATVIPISAPKLSGRGTFGADNQKYGILYLATSAPRYLRQFPFSAEQFSEYLVWQSLFVTSLHSEMRSRLRVRLHQEDLGWDMPQRWVENHPEVVIETWDIGFLDSLKNCRLYVCDHLSTTFVEALSLDKPSVLFWNPDTNAVRPEAQAYFDQLRVAGILYDTPRGATEAVAKFYDDVEEWWNEPGRQLARKDFCKRFAHVSRNAIDEWSKEFKSVYHTAF